MQKRICKLIKMVPPAITNKGVLFTSCLTVNIPVDGIPGYQSGCLLQATDGAAGAQLFVNTGTYDSCDFDAIAATEDVTGTLGALTDVGTLAYTNNDILMADGTKYQEVAGSSLPLLSATPGTVTASKAVIANAQSNIGAVKATSLAIGTSGAEVALTATIAQLNSLAAIPVSLGSSATFTVTPSATTTIIPLNATKARGALVVVHIDAGFTNPTGNQPTLTVGETGALTKAFAAATFVNATLGQVFIIGFANTANTDIIATWTAGTLTATGGATVTVIALPNS